MAFLSFPYGWPWDAPPPESDVVTKFSRLDGLPIVLTHGASLLFRAKFSLESKAMLQKSIFLAALHATMANKETFKLQKGCHMLATFFAICNAHNNKQDGRNCFVLCYMAFKWYLTFSTIFTSYLWRVSFRTLLRVWYSSEGHFLSFTKLVSSSSTSTKREVAI